MHATTQQPTATLISDETLLDDFCPSRFLKPSDLTDRWQVKSIDVIITRYFMVDTVPVIGDKDANGDPKVKKQPVMMFKLTEDAKEWRAGMIVGARVNKDALKAATGARTAGQTKGKRVTIQLDTHKNKQVLRINPMAPLAKVVEPGHPAKVVDGGPKATPTPTPQPQPTLITTPPVKPVSPARSITYSTSNIACELTEANVIRLRKDITEQPRKAATIFWTFWGRIREAYNATKPAEELTHELGAKIVKDQDNNFAQAFEYIVLAYGSLIQREQAAPVPA